MDERVPGVVEVLTSNGKMLFGVFSLLLALLFAFSGVYRRSGTIQREGTIEVGEVVPLEEHKGVDSGALTLVLPDQPSARSFEVLLLGKNEEKLDVRTLVSGEKVELKIGSRTSYFKLAGSSGEASYEYSLDYSYQPLRLLSILAALLTAFGIVAIYKGFDQFMSKFAERRIKESKEEEGQPEEGSHVDFMGSEGEKEDNQ